MTDSTASGAAADAVPERLVQGYSGRLLLAISLGWLAIQAGRLVTSPLLPQIKDALQIGDARAGFALTVLWGLYALLQYPSGRLSDQLSRKTLLVSGLALAAAGFVVLASAPTYAVFLLGAVIVGVGAGLFPTAARALVSDLYVEKRGRAFGLHTASGDIGGVTAAGVAAVVLAVAVWRVGYLPMIVVLAGVALALHAWSRESYVVERPDLAIRATGRRLFADGTMRWLLVGYTLYAFTWQATAGFLPTYLTAGKQFDQGIAALAFAVLFGVGAVVKPLAGYLGDHVPRPVLAPASLLLGAVALAAVVLADTPLLVVGAVVVFAAGLMSFPPVMQAYLMDLFPDESAGGDLGAMRTVYIGLGSIGPTFVGATATAFDYRLAFWVLVTCLAASAVLIRWVAE